MVVADIIIGPQKPPRLHTDEEVRAIGMPDLKPGRPDGDIEEHWLGVWELILWSLHFFGRPPISMKPACIASRIGRSRCNISARWRR